jgi:hypothetical protein
MPTTLVDPGWQWPDEECATLLHVNVQVWDLFDGQLLPDPETSRQASAALESGLVSARPSGSPVRRAVAIGDPEQDVLDEHLALYDRIAAQALLNQNSPLWNDHRGKPMVSIGPGLSDVGDCPLLLVLQGYQVPRDRAFEHSPQLSLGVIERSSGRLLWLRVLRLAEGDDLLAPEAPGRLIEAVTRGLMP